MIKILEYLNLYGIQIMKLIIILLFVGALFADGGHSHVNKELSHLSLSTEQTKEIKEILREFRDHLKEFEEIKRNTEQERKKLFIKDSFNIGELEKFDRSLDEKAREIEKNFLIKMHNILSLEQRTKFVSHFNDWEVK